MAGKQPRHSIPHDALYGQITLADTRALRGSVLKIVNAVRIWHFDRRTRDVPLTQVTLAEQSGVSVSQIRKVHPQLTGHVRVETTAVKNEDRKKGVQVETRYSPVDQAERGGDPPLKMSGGTAQNELCPPANLSAPGGLQVLDSAS